MQNDALSAYSPRGRFCHHHLLVLPCQLRSLEQAALRVGWLSTLRSGSQKATEVRSQRHESKKKASRGEVHPCKLEVGSLCFWEQGITGAEDEHQACRR